MKKTVPDSIVVAGHGDFALLSALGLEISKRAGGPALLASKFALMLRQCVDDVILTPKTGRRSYDELEKTEKTYIGTRVEIELRAMLHLPKGRLDTLILGHDVDIKNTMGSNWMIPTEAVDHPCILVAADEQTGLCYLGLIIAREAYLTAGKNKDSKKSISAQGFGHIFWLLKAHPYPLNFWHGADPAAVQRIFAGKSGNERVKTLFRLLQGLPISRDVIEAVARQKDFMRRVRADKHNKRKGTRDHLADEGILLLSGDYDAPLIQVLGLPKCAGSEFISYQPKQRSDLDLAVQQGLLNLDQLGAFGQVKGE